MVRHSYVHELRSAATYPLAGALAEGAFTSVVAAKYFDASPLLVAVITAAPMFGNIAALFWSQMAEHRSKVRFVNWLQLGVISLIAAVAITYPMPRHIGAWVFAAVIIAARVLVAGILTIRSTIWRLNYPRHVRGQIIARISAVATLVLAIATYGGARWLDYQPTAYVMLYPMAGILGLIGIWQFSKIRVRHEWRLRRPARILVARPEDMAQTGESNLLNYQPAPAGRRNFWRDAAQVLKDDPRFREYMRWQFLSGMAFMMMTPPLLLMVSREMTDPKRDYALATLIVQVIPMVISIVFTQIWAPYFDRVSILTFRVVQGIVSVAALLVMFAGAIYDQLWLIGVSQFLIGVSNGAGNLAWSLGHNDFAPADKAGTYMAVNVMLTGTRGFFAPFLGIWLYSSMGGRYVFGICALCSAVGQYGFYRMSRKYAMLRTAQDGAMPPSVARLPEPAPAAVGS